MTTTIDIAAANVLECDIEEITKEEYNHYGMDIFSANGMEFAICTFEEAQQAVFEEIRQSLWSFNAEFILVHSRVASSQAIVKALKEMQQKLCEDSNEIIYALIEDIDQFVADAVNEDGRGAFLSTYDGEEQEIKINGITFYAYRLN